MSIVTVTIEEPFQILGSVARDQLGDLQAHSIQIVVLVGGRDVSLKPLYHHDRVFLSTLLVEAYEKEMCCTESDYAEGWREEK